MKINQTKFVALIGAAFAMTITGIAYTIIENFAASTMAWTAASSLLWIALAVILNR